MKIVMVGTYPEPGAPITGGVQRVVDTLVRELARKVDLTLVVPGAEADRESTHHNVRTIYLKRAPGPGALRYWSIDALRLAQCVNSLKPDLVHLQGVAGNGRFITAPTIVTLHGIVEQDLLFDKKGMAWGGLARIATARVLKRIEERARRRVGNIIVINPYLVDALPDISALNLFHIPNPLDNQFLRAPASCDRLRAERIVSVGQIGPRKNTLGIIKIAAGALRSRPGFTLTICGSSADRRYHASCLDLIASEGLEGRVEMRGNVSTDELITLLDTSTCLVMMSHQETAPMAIVEANARGVPALAPEAFGIAHMIHPGGNGFFLPANNADHQVEQLKGALDHKWDRDAIARRCRDVYGPQHVVDMTLAAYAFVLSKQSKAL
jgi:glycosyltransferase involved in cell wall biosynthesis